MPYITIDNGEYGTYSYWEPDASDVPVSPVVDPEVPQPTPPISPADTTPIADPTSNPPDPQVPPVPSPPPRAQAQSAGPVVDKPAVTTPATPLTPAPAGNIDPFNGKFDPRDTERTFILSGSATDTGGYRIEYNPADGNYTIYNAPQPVPTTLADRQAIVAAQNAAVGPVTDLGGFTQEQINNLIRWQGSQTDPIFQTNIAGRWTDMGITDPTKVANLIKDAIQVLQTQADKQALGLGPAPWQDPDWPAKQAIIDAQNKAYWEQRAREAANSPFVAGGGVTTSTPGISQNTSVTSSTVNGKNTVTTTTTTSNAQTQVLAAAQQSVQTSLAASIRTNPSNYIRRRSGLPTVSAAVEAANANTVATLNNISTNIAATQANVGTPTVVQTTTTTDTASGQVTTTSVAAANNNPVSYITDPSLTTAVELAIGTYTAPLANASSTVAGNATTLGLNTAAVVVSNLATSTGNAVSTAAIPTTPVTTIATTPVATQSSAASDPLATVATIAALATAAAPALSKLLTPTNSTTVSVNATVGTNNVQNEYVAAVDATSTSTTTNWGIYNTTTGSFVITGLTEAEAVAGAAADNAAQPGNSSSQGVVAAANADADQIFKDLTTKQAALQAQTSFVNNGDWRVKLSLAPGAQYLYNDQNNSGILQPLQNTGGVIFPYTPQIDTNYRAEYDNYALTHSNYKSYAYKSSYVDSINLTANFTAQDTQEATYLLAVIQFFKSVTKMFYGANDPNRGVPPPLVFLTGLGEFQFNAHPCVVTNFAYSLPKDVDYIRARSTTINGTDLLTTRNRKTVATDIISSTISRLSNLFSSQGITKGAEFGWRPAPQTLGGASPTYVPTKMDITLTLLPIQSRSQVSQEFTLQNYANGNLLKGGFW